MKKTALILFLAITAGTYGQKTVQFADPLPPGQSSVASVDKVYFGQYKNTDSETTYLIDANGIAIVSTIVSYVTRQQVRESSALQVRNGYLLGIVKGDSVPCVEEGDRYYYGMQHKEVITGPGSLNILTRVDAKTYIINFHEGSYFEPSLLTFENGKMHIVHGELADQAGFASILHLTTIQRYGSPVDILVPSVEQWTKLMQLLFSGERLNYLKESE